MKSYSFFILIAEDNPDHAELIEATIKDCESAAFVCNTNNGEETLSHLFNLIADKQALPDIILMDIKMPRMNGIETLLAVKQHSELCNIPVIMLSTSTNESEMQTCLKSGASVYLAKPLDNDTFERVIRPLTNTNKKT
jgi:two-component system response regulator